MTKGLADRYLEVHILNGKVHAIVLLDEKKIVEVVTR